MSYREAMTRCRLSDTYRFVWVTELSRVSACALTSVVAHFTAQALADFFEYILDLLWDIHSLVRACTTSDGLDTHCGVGRGVRLVLSTGI
jgi:hypothetical protein